MKPWFLMLIVVLAGLLIGAAAVIWLEPVVPLFPGRPKYQAECLIRVGESDVERILRGETKRAEPPPPVVIREKLLRYDRVMSALEKTGVMTALKEKAGDDDAARERLEKELYERICANTYITRICPELFRIEYFADEAFEAFDVLGELSVSFVQNAFRCERDAARTARDMALRELSAAAEKLESLETRWTAFRQDHPGVDQPDAKVAELKAVSAELAKLDREISAKRRRLDRVQEQLEILPEKIVEESPDAGKALEAARMRNKIAVLKTHLAVGRQVLKPDHPAVQELAVRIKVLEALLARTETFEWVVMGPNTYRERRLEERDELEPEVNGRLEERRTLQLRKKRLGEEVAALPALVREFHRLERARQAALRRHQEAAERFKRVDRDFRLAMAGLPRFSIVSPVRRVYAPYVSPEGRESERPAPEDCAGPESDE